MESQISSNVFIFAVVIEVEIEALKGNKYCKLGAASKMFKAQDNAGSQLVYQWVSI